MLKFFEVHPEVAGGIGRGTIIDHSVTPRQVSRLVYEFADWFGDGILTSFPFYIVTEQLGAALRQSDLTGFVFDKVTVTKSLEFEDLYSSKTTGPLPHFEWLKITGVPYKDDMGLDMGTKENWHYRFMISERALAMFQKFGFEHGEIISTVEV